MATGSSVASRRLLEPSTEGRRPPRTATRHRVRGSCDLTTPCTLERERGSSFHTGPVPRPTSHSVRSLAQRAPSLSQRRQRRGGSLPRQKSHRQGPGRGGPAPFTGVGVQGTGNRTAPCTLTPLADRTGGGGQHGGDRDTRVFSLNLGSGKPSATTDGTLRVLCPPQPPGRGQGHQSHFKNKAPRRAGGGCEHGRDLRRSVTPRCCLCRSERQTTPRSPLV